ncbi:MAG: LytTR family DNA-binding domain-containing protein [Clostridia bacterium]|nr:LytTR family DNA-binding domain-containing protein [Clostridia bacterium]
MDFKVLIADDDEGMRLVLRKAIEKSEGFKVVGEAVDGESALHHAEALRPDVIFMDVEMPILRGVDSAKKILDINPKTIIIFATAHEEYMPKAFELYAFDYMVKPFRIDRISQTLARVKQLSLNLESAPSPARVPSPKEKALGKLIIRTKESVNLVDEEEILLVQREERSTVIYTRDERFVTSEGLTELEERLDSSVFFRSHKSYIINLTMVHKIYPYGRWTYLVKLKNTEKDALLTHDKFEELEKLFK